VGRREENLTGEEVLQGSRTCGKRGNRTNQHKDQIQAFDAGNPMVRRSTANPHLELTSVDIYTSITALKT